MAERKALGQYLLEEHLIDRQQLERALQVQANAYSGANTPLIGTVLVQMGAVQEQDVTRALEKQERDRGEA